MCVKYKLKYSKSKLAIEFKILNRAYVSVFFYNFTHKKVPIESETPTTANCQN